MWWAEVVFGADLDDFQKEALRLLAESDVSRVAIRACHGAGKSYIAALAVLWFFANHYRSRVITSAPTWHQIANVLWPEISKLHRIAEKRGSHIGTLKLTPRLEVNKEWFAVGKAAKEPETFEGPHEDNLMVVYEEAKGMPAWSWDSMDGMMSTGTKLKAMVISTPGVAFGPFYDCFTEKAWKWKHLHVPWQKAKRVSRQWVEERRREWGEKSPVFQSKCLANFYTMTKRALVPLDWMDRARSAKLDVAETAAVEMGVDVALEGDDWTVFCIRQGARVIYIESIQADYTTEISGRALVLAREYGVTKIKVDTIGLGAGVFGEIREAGFAVEQYKASWGAQDPEEFKNWRAETFMGLRKRFEKGEIDLSAVSPEEYNKLLPELTQIEWRPDSQGKTFIELKATYKKRTRKLRGGDSKSPDHADALCIAYAVRETQDWDFGPHTLETSGKRPISA